MRILGYQRKQGDFAVSSAESVHYDNVILHVVNSDIQSSLSDFVGFSCEQVKIKTKDLFNIFGCDYTSLSKFLDVDVSFQYSIVNSKVVLSKVIILDSNDDFKFAG